MAGMALLEREIEKRTDAQEQNRVSEEEREHQSKMAERMRALLSGEDIVPEPLSNEAPAYGYQNALRSDRVPAYQAPEYAATTEYHPPVVPNSPNAPSAARRIADYVPVTVGMQSLQRFADMPAGQRVTDYAPPAPAYAPANAPAYAPAPQAPAKEGLFETLLYRDGELLDTAPAAPEMTYEPAETPAPADSDEDALPTPRTMESLQKMQQSLPERNEGLLSALSMRTKLVLAAVAAVIVLLLAVVCINTAIINSINEDVATREQELTRLTERMDGINSEIEQLTSPENVEMWALEHGMSR